MLHDMFYFCPVIFDFVHVNYYYIIVSMLLQCFVILITAILCLVYIRHSRLFLYKNIGKKKMKGLWQPIYLLFVCMWVNIHCYG